MGKAFPPHKYETTIQGKYVGEGQKIINLSFP